MRFHRSALLAFEHYMASITAVSINGPALPASESHSSALVNAAWKDLAQISTRPHSFNSRQHELTRQYLLDRIQTVSTKSANSEHIDVISDESGFVITYDSNVGYWEGENVYVVIHGTSGTPGVLVSAHYDSVATAYGTTDDGIGVVTLLQLLEYFSGHRPFHNVVLNFNTGEEINLFGAHQFIKHPVSKYVSSFINLEGAGAGGRTALFRSSSYEALKAFSGSGPAFGSVIMQDIFKTGVVHSETDFEPYSEAGLHGLDMAFYKPRSRYHTALDNLKSTDKSSVKFMIDNALRLTNFLAGERYVAAEDNADELGVFFDIYGHKPLAFSMTGFARFSLFFAILGPTLIGYIVYYVMFKHPVVRVTAYGWVRMPVTFFFLVVVNITVVKMFTGHNPAIIYSSDLPIIAIGYFSLITSYPASSSF
ncbi:hypothetical protein BZA70DRAFT_298028 [Myxozyma melibiosi]|uniref:Peptide hydrolase n=1 Tax=Myxozyma melibiosi TaxID=54550 RepID=A0ABR1EXK5_9ASCO